ncbi:epidermal growth factor receptor substrate 15-like 1 isoform X2 [Salarias fasciatus]|uniref:epidermal growth factor receptor substrate 15-like 1 isoform X2 n=1 Tax=Salarias fasciatus TaxID=181472 RepID=UPI001176D0E9|nr:epidermal growth factor receptor substrate 15-like 1 isoform X2 [Salarias fasciatus]
MEGGGSVPAATGKMAALTSLTQLSSGNAIYESFYRQVDPGNSGRVGPTEAAVFLKKSGLPDSTLGKIWDLADPDGKGFLDRQGFYVALRLVACAQSGQEVGVASLGLTVPPPKFENSAAEFYWAVRPEEKQKFDGIFDSLLPVAGLLSGDKVKPVLINSKLPLDVLGKVWDLSDIDKDGHLDRDEFAVAMHLVYRALEKEPVPPVLPPSLVPLSKRKRSLSLISSSVSPSPPPPKDSLRSTPSHGSMTSLNSAGSLSPKHPLKTGQHSVNWVVPVSERGRYDDIFLKTDADLDGFVSGLEVKDIFMQSGLSQNVLAHIWSLSDTRQQGKLTREQFSLAMHLIQQKVLKNLDPPQTLSPDMVPPSERSVSGYVTPVGSDMAAEMRRDSSSSVGSGEFCSVKEPDDISQEIAQLQREKFSLEQDIRDMEDTIRHKTAEVQDMQSDLDRETSVLQDLEAQKQDAQDRLDDMDQQKHKLEDMLDQVRIKVQEESQMISSLQNQIRCQETDLQNQEDELSRAQLDLDRLHQEEEQLAQNLAAGKVQLETIIKSLKATQDQIHQARSKLSQIQDSQQDVSRSMEQSLNGTHGGSMTNLADMSEPDRAQDDPFQGKPSVFHSQPQEVYADPFQNQDPFRTDPFKGDPFQNEPTPGTDPFGGDPFKESDPFQTSSEDFFKKSSKLDPFSSPDPFSKSSTLPLKAGPNRDSGSDPFCSSQSRTRGTDLFGTLDPFGTGSFSSGSTGFADFSHMIKEPEGRTGWQPDFQKSIFDTPALPPKKSIPPRPKPPSGKTTPVTAEHPKPGDPFQPFRGDAVDPFQIKKSLGDPFSGKDPFAPAPRPDKTKLGNEAQQLEWAKRESERAERERLKRLRQQEQEDLELAIALSKAEMSNT